MTIRTIFIILFLYVGNTFAQSLYLNSKQTPEHILRHLEGIYEYQQDTIQRQSFTEKLPDYPEVLQEQHFPYPVIFIHGLVGSTSTWMSFYQYALSQGWTYGGDLKYNLNSDNDNTYSNIYGSSPDVKVFKNTTVAGDFYLINFNCDPSGICYGSGTTASLSNQAAITKQGLALREAIAEVLLKTGKDKVILFGHSMGGLCARQYLQNPNFWQKDGKHHVSKLITSGTPHGGSNFTGSALSAIVEINENADAFRDLRANYTFSQKPGVFLFGGREDPDYMRENLFGFYNYDVSCDGKQGQNIMGLNQKQWPNDVDCSIIIGDWVYDQSGGDFIVSKYSAQIKNYFNIESETFLLKDNTFLGGYGNGDYVLHTAMPKFTNYNFWALDEPDVYPLSYTVKPDVTYNGFITPQADDTGWSIDYDDYVFKITFPTWVTVWVDNASTYPFGISILKQDESYLYDEKFSAKGTIKSKSVFLSPGTYYLELYATGNATSWQYPYHFRIQTGASTSVSVPIDKHGLEVYPNPSNGICHIEWHEGNASISIMNEIGQLTSKVEGQSGRTIIDMSAQPDGIYFVKIETKKGVASQKILLKK